MSDDTKQFDDLCSAITEAMTTTTSEDGSTVNLRLKKSNVMDIAKEQYNISEDTYKAVHDFDNDMTQASIMVAGTALNDHVQKSNQSLDDKRNMKAIITTPGHGAMEKSTITARKEIRNPADPDNMIIRHGYITVKRTISKPSLSSVSQTVGKMLEESLS